MAPALGTAKAPRELSISELNSMAFGLAVYASQGWLPSHHARLASGRWSGATGRAFHPQGSSERFQVCILTSHPPFPSLAWRKPGGPGSLPTRGSHRPVRARLTHTVPRITALLRTVN
jgi:hypothetical protein